MTECSTYISSGPGIAVQPGSPGKPQPGRQIAVLNNAGQPIIDSREGLLAIHQDEPGLMLGYLDDQPMANRLVNTYPKNWFLTGDRARQDADGYSLPPGPNWRRDERPGLSGFAAGS